MCGKQRYSQEMIASAPHSDKMMLYGMADYTLLSIRVKLPDWSAAPLIVYKLLQRELSFDDPAQLIYAYYSQRKLIRQRWFYQKQCTFLTRWFVKTSVLAEFPRRNDPFFNPNNFPTPKYSTKNFVLLIHRSTTTDNMSGRSCVTEFTQSPSTPHLRNSTFF